jgi:hypothetical protein
MGLAPASCAVSAIEGKDFRPDVSKQHRQMMRLATISERPRRIPKMDPTLDPNAPVRIDTS